MTDSATLTLEDGSSFSGTRFGWPVSVTGEVVFNTGMVGYPECLTDPSYRGQVLVLTYPLVGNYGVPGRGKNGSIPPHHESGRIQVSALVVAESCARHSHWNAAGSLDDWLRSEQVPGLAGVDTRALTQVLRQAGTMLGKVCLPGDDMPLRDPNQENLVARVSISEPRTYGTGRKRVTVVDCGCKDNILRALLKRGVAVTVVPWDWPLDEQLDCDGVVLSNGPGDPQRCGSTIQHVRRLLDGQTPILGICLGSQILALAAGAETYKLKYGHRSQNQPCVLVGTQRCFITSQNHGYAVDETSLPEDWEPWFRNANDGTNEGVRHRRRPWMGVQFHPEASPGPVDTAFIFDQFLAQLAR